MVLYDSEGNKITCEKDQMKILLANGYTVEKPEIEGSTGSGDKAPSGKNEKDFKILSEEEVAGMKLKERTTYFESLKVHNESSKV